MIAVQGLGYVTAHNWAYIAPFGAAACLSLRAGAALGPGFSRETVSRPGAWRLSTTSPAILQRLLQHSAPGRRNLSRRAVVGERIETHDLKIC